jgi:hypothetical protein
VAATRGGGLPRAAERGQHVRGRLESLRRVLGQGLLQHLHENRGQARDDLQRRHGLLLQDLEEHGVHRLRVERLAAGQELVQHATQREDIRTRVGTGPPHLLRGHVVRGSHDRPRAGHVGAAHAGQPEVHDLDLAAGEQVDVGRLEVAVDHVVGVGEGEPRADLLGDVELVVERHLALGEGELQVDPAEQLHGHDELLALDPQLVDGDDVRVVQVRGGARLALEALPDRVVGVEAGRDALDRHVPVQHGIVGAKHLAHGSLAELALDLVPSDLRGYQNRGDLTTPQPLSRAPARLRPEL